MCVEMALCIVNGRPACMCTCNTTIRRVVATIPFRIRYARYYSRIPGCFSRSFNPIQKPPKFALKSKQTKKAELICVDLDVYIKSGLYNLRKEFELG